MDKPITPPTLSFNLTARATGQVLSGGLSALLTLLIIRSLSVTDYGHLTFLFSSAALLTVIMDAGLHLFTTREIAQHPNDAAMKSSQLLTAKIVLGGFCILMTIPIYFILPSTRLYLPSFFLVACFLAGQSFIEGFQAIYQGHERLDLSSTVAVLYRVLMLFFTGLILLTHPTVSWVIGSMGVAALMTIAINYVWIGKTFFSHRLVFRGVPWRAWWSRLWPISMTTFLTALYARAGVIILAHVYLGEEVGWFGAAYKMYEFSTAVPAVAVAALLPRFAKLAHDDPAGLRRLVRITIPVMFGLGIPAALAGLWWSEPLSLWLFGPDYLGAAPALRWLCLAIPIMFMNFPLGALLIALHRQHALLAIAGTCAILNIAANLSWVCSLGAAAPALATLCTEGCFLVLAGGYLLKNRLKVSIT